MHPTTPAPSPWILAPEVHRLGLLTPAATPADRLPAPTPDASPPEGAPFDVVVIGSGPAGLQAALTLGRGQRRVAVVEGTARRNAAAHAIHNVIGSDGAEPKAFRDAAWHDLATYGVVRIPGDVDGIDGTCGAFVVTVGNRQLPARRVVLATGMVDQLPSWPGLRELWGPTVFQCPFCHGHELRGRRWGIVVNGGLPAAHLALFAVWTRDLIVFTDGTPLDPAALEVLGAHGVPWVDGPIEALRPSGDNPSHLGAVVVNGSEVACDALVLRPPQAVVPLVQALDLPCTEMGMVSVDEMGRTPVPGIYAVGDTTTPMQAVVGGMALGLKAAAALCFELAHEDWDARLDAEA